MKEADLASRANDEIARLGDRFEVPLTLGLYAAVYVAAELRTALRPPRKAGPSAKLAGKVIDRIADALDAAGYHAHAEMARAGDVGCLRLVRKPAAPHA
jgi:hypothetical protein